MELSRKIEILKRKKDFVRNISKVLADSNEISIVNVDYKLFQYNEDEELIDEYLEVTYNGGGVAYRNCSGNSEGAIFKEISKLLFGGYYDEVDYVEQTYFDKNKWTEITD